MKDVRCVAPRQDKQSKDGVFDALYYKPNVYIGFELLVIAVTDPAGLPYRYYCSLVILLSFLSWTGSGERLGERSERGPIQYTTREEKREVRSVYWDTKSSINI